MSTKRAPPRDGRPLAARHDADEHQDVPRREQREHAEALVYRVVRELIGTPSTTLAADTPLMDAGVDSLSATELTSRPRAGRRSSCPARTC